MAASENSLKSGKVCFWNKSQLKQSFFGKLPGKPNQSDNYLKHGKQLSYYICKQNAHDF